jgi:hypothetical protein
MRWITIDGKRENLPRTEGQYHVVRLFKDGKGAAWFKPGNEANVAYWMSNVESWLDESPDSKGTNLDHEDWVLGRLYDWLIDPKRKPSITAFTAGSLRKVARQIEYQSADDDIVTDALSCYWRFCKSELEKKDLGDIERKNYESIEKKVRERLKNS